ncbi:MAG: DUF4390 domain-containing protein [Ectothiorhodospiraceae bacterium AqS1]|nr:DUF4390 domain-containing protein [Ectothiorhodospiraceae bacterium AqS1]
MDSKNDTRRPLALSSEALGKRLARIRVRSRKPPRKSPIGAASIAFALFGLCLLLPPAFARALSDGGASLDPPRGFKVQRAAFREDDEYLALDADIGFGFGEESLDAIHSGVSLTILVDIELRQGPWWWRRVIAAHRLRYRIHFNGLTGRYALRSPGPATIRSHSSLDEMLKDIGRLRSVPIIALEDLPRDDPSSPLHARIRALIDIEALPAPLRPIAWFSPHWRGLGSGWFEWSPRSLAPSQEGLR